MSAVREVARPEAIARREWRWVVMPTLIAIGLFTGGCSANKSPQPKSAERPGASVEAEHASAEAAAETSSELAAAETAFRTMTTQNVTPAEWEAANQKLQDMGPPALPVLVKGLKSDDVVKREMASTVLAWFGIQAEPVAEQLRAALDDKSGFVRANVATALLQMPEHADRVVPVLAEFLRSDDDDLKRMAATNLAAIETDNAVPLLPQLAAALDDEDREVVYYCVKLLGRIGPEAAEALPKLKALDTGDDAELRSAVDTAILRIDREAEAAGRS